MREKYDSALVRLKETGDSGNECTAGTPAYNSGNSAESEDKRGNRFLNRKSALAIFIQEISWNAKEILGDALLVARLLCKHDRIQRRGYPELCPMAAAT